MGGGIQDTYHRRPVVQPDDIAAMMPVMLGSGVNLYGTYMFQGGENPEGRHTTLQESQSTGYPTDVPVKSYDFQAPLSEFGRERESLRKLKVVNYFLNDFGSGLAPMSVHAPDQTPAGAAEFSVVRASVRSKDRQGYLFVNNYVRGASMPERKSVQFEIRLPHSTLRIPDTPIQIPSGAYFIWPFNFPLGSQTLRYSTAQLFLHLAGSAAETYVFEQIPGIDAEFVLDSAPGVTVQARGATVRKHDSVITISQIPAGFNNPITLRHGAGPETKLILLTQTEAENAWKIAFDGQERVLETAHDFFGDDRSFVLQSDANPEFVFSLYPQIAENLNAVGAALAVSRNENVVRFTGSVRAINLSVKVEKVQDASDAPAVKLGPSLSWRPQGVPMAPDDDAFERAAKWRILIKGDLSGPISDAFLTIRYTGDVARLSANGKLLDDDFYNGLPWSIGLRRFYPQARQDPLELSILPLRKDSPVFLEPRFRPEFGVQDQAVELKSVVVSPQYEIRVEMPSKQAGAAAPPRPNPFPGSPRISPPVLQTGIKD
jgi:hypothetical protein